MFSWMYTWNEVDVCYAKTLWILKPKLHHKYILLDLANIQDWRLFPHFFVKNLISCCFSDFCGENTCRMLCSDIKVMFCRWLSNAVTVSSVLTGCLLQKILVGRLWLEEKNGPSFTQCPSIQAINYSHPALPFISLYHLHYTSYRLKRSQEFSFLCTLQTKHVI